MPRYERFVAIGDSTVEGLDDPAEQPDGMGGYHGWANRLAGRIANAQGSVLYANLGIRGRTTRQVRDEQLAPALAMRPDLAAVVSGTNDLLRGSFDAVALRADVEAMQRALIDGGATVVTFTLPDLSPIMPIARMLRRRLVRMNDAIRAAAADTGAIVCDFADWPVASDARLWSPDRLHANSAGHARIAEALAEAVGIAGATRAWAEPLPPALPRGMAGFLGDEGRWLRGYLLPWLWRHARGRSSGDGIRAKLPELTRIKAGTW
jgi:lysophospholipase L1-like esterase